MSEATRELHLTNRQIHILCEGLKLVQRNPAGADELATAERMQLHFQQLVGAPVQYGGAGDERAAAESGGTPGAPAQALTREQMQERVRLLSDEMDANDEENRMMQAEIDELYAKIDASPVAGGQG